METLINILTVCIPLVALSWLVPEKWQLLPMVAATAIFLGLVSPLSLAILTGTTLISFYTLKYYPSLTGATLTVVIQASAVLIFFKLEYGAKYNLLENSILPLGLSYYSFRQIHYAIEAYKRQLPKHNIIQYISYLFFLPTILIGPINRFQPFYKDLQRRRWDTTLFSKGLERILYGMVKIVVLGNYLFTFKLNNFAHNIQEDHSWLADYLQMVKFFGNTYVQFAGYSDVAIGLSMLFGFKIIENFNYPFMATNISDFWRRWHISLSDWCRDYVFYPFLAMIRNSWISIIISMLVLAAWHEISIRYLLWGIMHALAISIWHGYERSWIPQKLNPYPMLKKGLGIFITVHFVMLSFVIIREDSLVDAFEFYQRLFLLNF